MATDQGILAKIKNNLRISHTKLDDDLNDTIAACQRDLAVYGVRAYVADDPLILNAIKLYCKSEYTDDPVKAAAYRERYDALKSCLGTSGEYREDAVNE